MSDLFDDDDFEKIDLEDGAEDDISEIEKEYDEEYALEDENEDNSKAKFFHIAFLVIFLSIIGIGTYTLVKWQKGERLVITEDDLSESYDIESEDYYIDFKPNKIDGYVDDGELNICILTDGTIGDIEDENSIPSIIARETGGHVDALSIDCPISIHEKSYSLNYPEDAFSLYYIASAVSASDDGDYELMKSALGTMAEQQRPDYGKYYEYWDKLHKLDFDIYDVIIICYGYEDYKKGIQFTGSEIYSQQQYGTADSANGALDASIKTLKNRFPYAQIIVSSPSFFLHHNNRGDKKGADIINTGSGTLGEYVVNFCDVARMRSVSFIDNYFGLEEYNCSNYEDCLDENGLPNDKAKSIIANHLLDNLYFRRTSK